MRRSSSARTLGLEAFTVLLVCLSDSWYGQIHSLPYAGRSLPGRGTAPERIAVCIKIGTRARKKRTDMGHAYAGGLKPPERMSHACKASAVRWRAFVLFRVFLYHSAFSFYALMCLSSVLVLVEEEVFFAGVVGPDVFYAFIDLTLIFHLLQVFYYFERST